MVQETKCKFKIGDLIFSDMGEVAGIVVDQDKKSFRGVLNWDDIKFRVKIFWFEYETFDWFSENSVIQYKNPVKKKTYEK